MFVNRVVCVEEAFLDNSKRSIRLFGVGEGLNEVFKKNGQNLNGLGLSMETDRGELFLYKYAGHRHEGPTNDRDWCQATMWKQKELQLADSLPERAPFGCLSDMAVTALFILYLTLSLSVRANALFVMALDSSK